MKYRLMVSRDCGTSYFNQTESDSLEELQEKGEDFDKQWLRWYIEETESHESVDGLCAIHRDILATVISLRQKEAASVTNDNDRKEG